jgi:hypothetical protein
MGARTSRFLPSPCPRSGAERAGPRDDPTVDGLLARGPARPVPRVQGRFGHRGPRPLGCRCATLRHGDERTDTCEREPCSGKAPPVASATRRWRLVEILTRHDPALAPPPREGPKIPPQEHLPPILACPVGRGVLEEHEGKHRQAIGSCRVWRRGLAQRDREQAPRALRALGACDHTARLSETWLGSWAGDASQTPP